MPDERAARVFSRYGIGSAVLGVIAVVATVCCLVVWSGHRAASAERDYQSQVLQAAADWTGVLVNMNKDSVTSSMQTLHEGTAGRLNAEFEASMAPFTQLVLKLQAQTTGQVDSVAIDELAQPAPPPELADVRTDAVLVAATSVTDNAGGDAPQTVQWNLRLDVSAVDGGLRISRVEAIR